MRKILMLTVLSAVILAAAVLAVSDSGNKESPSNTNNVTVSTAAAAQPNLPVTNGVKPKRNPDGTLALSKEMQNAVSTSHEGLVEVDAPGGGTMVDLQGRFRSLSIAETDADGNITVKCLGGTDVMRPVQTQKNTGNHGHDGEVCHHE